MKVAKGGQCGMLNGYIVILLNGSLRYQIA